MIRRAAEPDIPGIIEIEKVSFADPWEEKLFLDAIDSKNKNVFIAEEGACIAGYIVLEKVLDEGHITNMAVGKKHRKKGIASRLVGKALDLAKSLDIKEIFLEVRESNVAAKKLYSKFGFEQLSRRKGYYPMTNEDALILSLKL
ncbi:MAG: ribosomal protein S18-alanine N-acetyltransferase [bacterium]